MRASTTALSTRCLCIASPLPLSLSLADAPALPHLQSDDEEDARYLISLRTAVAEAWQGMFQAFIPEEGVTAAGKAAMKEQSAVLGPYIPEVCALVKKWLQEAAAEGVEHELDILKVLVGLLG